MILERSAEIPSQRPSTGPDFEVVRVSTAKVAHAILAGELVMVENGPVIALAGDANNLALQRNISDVKKDRSPDQPVGWIAPFQSSIEAFELSSVTDPTLVKFLLNSDEMTRRLGALAFVRGPANMAYKARFGIPDSLIPRSGVNGEPSTVQLYSPTANDRCSRLVRYATAHGARIAMTSANYHGQKEIVDYDEARDFAKKEGDLLFLPQYKRGEKPQRPRGSYPVLSILPDRLRLIRYGFLEPGLMADVLDGLPVDISPGITGQLPKHPENVLRRIDLEPEFHGNKGASMHNAIVSKIAI